MTGKSVMRINVKLGKEDLEWAIGLNRAYFNFLGVWPEMSSKKTFQKALQVSVEILFLAIAVVVPEIWALILVKGHLPLVLDNLVPTTGIMASTIKLFLLWRSKHQLAEIIMIITLDWHREKLDWERNIMLRMARKGRYITIYGLLFVIFSVSGVFVGPVVGLSFRNINNITDHMDRYLPLQAFYPYDVRRTPYFELSFMSQLIGGLFMGMVFMGPITLFAVLVHHTCGQLEILKLKIKHFNVSHSNAVEYGRSKIGFRTRIAEVVNTHVQIIGTIEAIKKIYKVLILVQIATLCVIMCSLGFQVINVLNEDGRLTIKRMLTPFGNGMGALIYSYIYCSSGEILINYSEDYLNGLYDTDWFMFPSRNSKDLLTIMQRAQHPLYVTAGNIMMLKMESFSKVIKTSAGYLSVLLAVREN